MLLTRSGCVLYICLVLLSCTPSPDEAREELALRGLQWNQKNFLIYAELGGTHIVKLFLRGGMDPNVTDEMGRTALMKAASKGHLETVKALLEAGADPQLKDKFSDTTALALAREHGHPQVAKLLE